MNTDAFGRNLLLLCFVAIVGMVGYSMLHAPDERSAGDRIGDAMDQLGDRTPGEKLGDAVKDAGNDLKKATN